MHNWPWFQEHYLHLTVLHQSNLKQCHVIACCHSCTTRVSFLGKYVGMEGHAAPETANLLNTSNILGGAKSYAFNMGGQFCFIMSIQITTAVFILPTNLRKGFYAVVIVSNEQCVSSLLLSIYLFCFSNWLRLNCILLYNCECTCRSHLYSGYC